MKNQTRGSLGPASRRALCIILWLAFATVISWAGPVTVTDFGDPIGQAYGIGAVGSGFFGPGVRFDPFQNLSGQGVIGGGNFFLATQGDIPATSVPEPITMAMIGAGLIGLGILRRRAVR